MISIFLTGERQIGKSTAISLFLEELRKQERDEGRDDPVIGGFRTVFGSGESGRIHYMVRIGPDCFCPGSLNNPYDPEILSHASEKMIVAESRGDGMTGKPESFDSFSATVFRDTEKCSLVLMDELGFLEKDAGIFRLRTFFIFFTVTSHFRDTEKTDAASLNRMAGAGGGHPEPGRKCAPEGAEKAGIGRAGCS